VRIVRPRTFIYNERNNEVNLSSRAPWVLGPSIRLPLFLLLVILEPVVNPVLGSLALLGF
jgi:hypothetical protein